MHTAIIIYKRLNVECRQTHDESDIVTMDQTEILESANSSDTGLSSITSGSRNAKNHHKNHHKSFNTQICTTKGQKGWRFYFSIS